jgi:hypothetical protein
VELARKFTQPAPTPPGEGELVEEESARSLSLSGHISFEDDLNERNDRKE